MCIVERFRPTRRGKLIEQPAAGSRFDEACRSLFDLYGCHGEPRRDWLNGRDSRARMRVGIDNSKPTRSDACNVLHVGWSRAQASIPGLEARELRMIDG